MQDGDIISRAQSSSGAGAKKEMRDVRTFTALITLGEDKLRRELLRRGLSGAGSRRQMAKRTKIYCLSYVRSMSTGLKSRH